MKPSIIAYIFKQLPYPWAGEKEPYITVKDLLYECLMNDVYINNGQYSQKINT